MPIKLDWRFAALSVPAKVHMKELWDFCDQAEKNFEVAIKAWDEEAAGLTEEEEAMNSDYLIDRRDSIEALLDRGQTLCVVAVFTFLERFLNLVVDHLRAGGAPIPESKKGFDLKLVRHHLLSAKVNIGRPPFDWHGLDQIREIRNCIVHTGGWVTEDFVNRLADVGIMVKEDTQLKLPEKYFKRCWTLVNETYQLLHKQCWEQFGYGKQQEMWLKPTRSFTSKELQEILQEAIAAGIVAREEATKRLLTDAKNEGLKQEDSCGWVWLEIDPKLLKHIDKLLIPNVGTSFNTTARVEDFKLYLKDVADYQRMSASLRGIQAARVVLQNHGINSRVQSLAD